MVEVAKHERVTDHGPAEILWAHERRQVDELGTVDPRHRPRIRGYPVRPIGAGVSMTVSWGRTAACGPVLGIRLLINPGTGRR